MNRPLLLVVEDDSDLRGVVALALRNYGYEVKEAGTGCEALRLISVRAPDAVILDLGLPDIDGFEVAASIRAEHSSRSSFCRRSLKNNIKSGRWTAGQTTT